MITYILKSQELFNIGKTKDLSKRLKAYKTHCPYFEVVRTFDGDYENVLHRHFKKFRRGTEEWFALTDEQVKNIDISYFLERNYVEVINEDDAFILQSIINSKRSAVYCEKNNIKHIPFDESNVIKTCCPDYKSLQDWLIAHPKYIKCVEIEVNNYRKLLNHY